MGDFAQTGVITTLQRLNGRAGEWLEAELEELAQARPIALVLPCHAADLEQPALRQIRDELAGARWLREIVVALNGIDEEGLAKADALFRGLPQKVRLLWTDGPAVSPVLAHLLDREPWALPAGKGLNLWAALGLLSTTTRPELIVTQDCDVRTFRRLDLARLCYPCAHPELNFAFAKMYYPRATDRLYGRISRLFLAPLLRALGRVAGPAPLLRFLESFRYPLAGEAAIRTALAERVAFASGWGAEISTLCEVFREVDPHVVCQVDGGDEYDHKHQHDVAALTQMCRAVAEALIAAVDRAGSSCGPASRLELRTAYTEESREAIRRSAALARINRLPFDLAGEQQLTAAFAGALTVHERPLECALPSWEKLRRERPDAVTALAAAFG